MRFSRTSNVLPLMSRVLYAKLLLGICLHEAAVFSAGFPPQKKDCLSANAVPISSINPAVGLKEICSVSLHFAKSC